jgi:TRAP-type C4-dicarboxylate transport system substrate-binding protein
MVKKVLFLVCVVSLLFSTYSLTHADVIKLKFGNFYTVTHLNSTLFDKYCQELNKKLAGKVEITHYTGSTLLSATKVAAGVAHGIADIGLSNLAYTKGLFPVMEMMDLPLGFPSGWVASHVANDFSDKFKPKELDPYHVFMFTTCPPNVIMTMKPVKTLEDLKGMRIRGTGGIADIVKALGGTPVPIEWGDIYDSLRKGVIGGTMLPLETMKGANTGEVLKYVTSAWKIGSVYTFYVFMNKKKWDTLPSDVQKVITDYNKDFLEKWPGEWNKIDYEGLDFFKKNGGQIVTISEAESARWVKAVEPIIQSSKKDLMSKGFKAADIDSYVKFIRERIEYWNGQQKALNIPSALPASF